MRALPILIALGTAAVAATATGAWLFGRENPCANSARATLEDRALPATEELAAWLGMRRGQLLERTAYLETPERAYAIRFADLGIDLDVTATTQKLAAALSASGSCTSRAFQKLTSEVPPPVSVAPVFAFDRERARQTLEAIAPLVNEEAVDARLDLLNHRRIDEHVGRELDIDATLEAIARGARDEGATYGLVFREIHPAVTSAMLAAVDVSQVLSAYETDFSKLDPHRIPNIRRAAELLNGTVIGPRETLSFNKTVGPRVLERGFTAAPVIIADVMDEGVGGGVCQVASTLHAAARFAGLEVPDRRSHSRPIGYTPLGLDAVVLDEIQDLKLRNPYDTPLIVHAFLPTKTTLRVEFLGRPKPRSVRHSFKIEQHETFHRIVVTRPDFPPKRIKKHQKGSPGYVGTSTVRIEHANGKVSIQRYPSRYWPAPEIYWIGPEVDPSELPPLPQHATHVEYSDPQQLEAQRAALLEATNSVDPRTLDPRKSARAPKAAAPGTTPQHPGRRTRAGN